MHAPRPSLPTTHEIKSSNEYHVEREWLATLLTKKKTTGYAQQSLIRVLPNEPCKIREVAEPSNYTGSTEQLQK
jgi:hypothetical protein